MNTLSWLLYGAELTEGLKLLGILGGMACGIASIPAAIAVCVCIADKQDVGLKISKAALKWAVSILFVCCLISVVAPSRKTVLLIAASEAGQQILSTEQGQAITGEAGQLAADSLRVLRNFINDQLAAKTI